MKSLIYLHGFMGKAYDWNPCIPGISFYSLDLPGHGDCEVMELECYAQKIHQFLEKENIKDPIFYGYSMGGRVLLMLLNNDLISPSKIILESASFGLKTSQEKEERLFKDLCLSTKLSSFDDPLSFLKYWYDLDLFQGMKEIQGFDQLIDQRCSNDFKKLAKSLEIYTVARQKIISHLPDHLYLCGEWDQKYCEQDFQGLNKKVISKASHNCHFMNESEVISNLLAFL